MLRGKTLAVAAAFALPLATGASAQNLFVNPGFEDPVTTDGPPFIGFWEAFNGGGAFSVNDTVMPRSGAQHLNMTIDSTENTFAGAFQDVVVTAGTTVKYTGYHKIGSEVFDVVPEIRIEWRDSTTDTEVSRTDNFVPDLTTDYTMFELEFVVPEGADTARAVYAIQTFSSGDFDTGAVFLDDVAITPEPASLALLGLGGLAALSRRRA